MVWTLWVFFLLFSISALIYPLWWKTDAVVAFGNMSQIIVLILAGLNLNQATHQFPPRSVFRKVWAQLTTGIWIWVLGQSLESYCELLLNQVAYATVADSFWVIGYFPVLKGLLTLIQYEKASILGAARRQRNLFMALSAVVVYVAILYSLTWPQLADPTRKLTFKMLDVTYVSLDYLTIILSFLSCVAYWSTGKPVAPWAFLFLGLFLSGIADIGLSYSTDPASFSYRFLDILYLLSYFFVALSGYSQVRLMKSGATRE